MALLRKSERLKKELGLFDVYVIATGATLSSGFFLLPGLAAASAGPALPLAYLLAGILLLPGIVSMAELSTAMPRAGGVYYFLDRSMGPLMGAVGGFGTWLSLVLKTAFALIGVGAYLGIFFPDVPIVPVAVGFAIFFAIVNLVGAKKSSTFQAFLVVGLLILLLWFSGVSLFAVKAEHFTGILTTDFGSITYTAGLVVVSYMGLTKVASVAEEVRNPERNLPLGMFLALGTALVIYTVGTALMVGVIGADVLGRNGGDLRPVATVAEVLAGRTGAVVVTVAAVLAFGSVANAGIMSASRYPLAMGRDHLLPRAFRFVNKRRVPTTAIFVTLGLILLVVTLFDPSKIAKLAGAFQLFMFALSCLAVIVMRESHIESYDPGFRSPFYPWLQLIGILAPVFLISLMGRMPIAFTLGLMLFGSLWYFYYARGKVARGGAVLHVFERLGRRRYEGLDRELRNILKEKGLRIDDPFDQTVARSFVIDLSGAAEFDDVVTLASDQLEHRVPGSADTIRAEFLEGTRIGATPVTHGVALPHLRKQGLQTAEMVIVRAKDGVRVPPDEFHESGADQIVSALFFLVSPDEDPGQHLRILAQIAERVDDESFMERWLVAETDQELREILLQDDRFLSLELKRSTATEVYIGKTLRELEVPENALVAMIRRGTEIVIPRGSTLLQEGDWLTFIGTPEAITMLEQLYTSGLV